jgi:hypothetical protein
MYRHQIGQHSYASSATWLRRSFNSFDGRFKYKLALQIMRFWRRCVSSYDEGLLNMNQTLHSIIAVRSTQLQTERHIQPLKLRAPEVILGIPWSTKIDIFNFSALVSAIIQLRFRAKTDAGIRDCYQRRPL